MTNRLTAVEKIVNNQAKLLEQKVCVSIAVLKKLRLIFIDWFSNPGQRNQRSQATS